MRAEDKLRNVLDYVSCEACLATPSPEQELLCSLCTRLDRTIAVKAVVRTHVILERPEPAAAGAPVEISPVVAATPAAPAAEPETVPAEADTPSTEEDAGRGEAPSRLDRFAGLLRRARPGSRSRDSPSDEADEGAEPVEDAPAQDATPQVEAPLPVEVVTKRRSLLPFRRSSPAIEVVVEPIDEEPEPDVPPVSVPVQVPAEAEAPPAAAATPVVEEAPLEAQAAPAAVEAPAEAQPEPSPAPVEWEADLVAEPTPEPATAEPAQLEDAPTEAPAPVQGEQVEEQPQQTEPAVEEAPARRGRFFGFFRRKDASADPPVVDAEAPADASAAAEDDEDWDDLVSYDAPPADPTREPVQKAAVVDEADDEEWDDDLVSYEAAPAAPAEPEPPEAVPTPTALDAQDEDDADAWMEADEVPLEPPRESAVADDALAWAPPAEAESDTTAWAPPQEPEAAAQDDDEEVFEMEVLEDEPSAAEEEDVLEMEIVDDEEEDDAPPAAAAPAEPPAKVEPEPVSAVPSPAEPALAPAPAPEPEEQPVPAAAAVATEVEPDPTPAPAPSAAAAAPELTPESDDSDLWRLDHFTPAHRATLHAAGIDQLAHLSGQDATQLAEQTGIPRDTLRKWQHTADFVTQAGIPIDGARAMVNAGIEGPGALAALEVDAVIEQVELSGGGVTAREVKRWKRRV